MTRPDIDAIRAEHCNPNLINAGARKAVRELLAYVADLEERCRGYEAMQHAIKRAIDTWKQKEVGDET